MKLKKSRNINKKESRKSYSNPIPKEIFFEYIENSNLHGVAYIGAKNKNIFIRLGWLIALILSITAFSYLIKKTWIKWQENPVIMNFEEEQKDVSSIPFPAVTVCPINKIKQTEYNITEMLQLLEIIPGKEFYEFYSISLICDFREYGIKQFPDVKFNLTTIEKIKEFAPTLEETITNVVWNSKKSSKTLFTPHFTEEGLCFSFNSFNQEDMFTNKLHPDLKINKNNMSNKGWKLETGYPQQINEKDYPFRTSRAGYGSGLSFILISILPDKDIICGKPIDGFKIVLHNPVESPRPANQYIILSENEQATILVTPEMTTTSKLVSSLSSKTRKCYYPHEKSLRFYKVYNHNNCQYECEINVTLAECGCVPYYMPHDRRTELCRYNQIDCYQRVLYTMMTVLIDIDMCKNPDNKHLCETFKKCDCLPACFELQYLTETSRTKLFLNEQFKSSKIFNIDLNPMFTELIEKELIVFTQVDIFFKDAYFTALRRDELHGLTDFLANCGGLLGLSMGFSLSALVEILYFFILRMWLKYRKQRNK